MTPDTQPPVSPRTEVRLRPAAAEDVPELRRLYRNAILATGPAAYGPDAVAAWAEFAGDASAFGRFVLESRTWVAVAGGGEAAGFAGLGAEGYVASLYVAPRHARRGVASLLLAHLLAVGRGEGVRRFHAAASIVSLPVFLRFGFSVAGEETVERQGVPLLRYRVVLEESSE